MYFLGWVHCNFYSNIHQSGSKLAEIFAHLNFLTIKSGQRRSYTSSKKTLHGGASCVSCHHLLFQQILYCISLNRLKTQHIFGHDVMVISRLLISVSCWQSTRLAAGDWPLGELGRLRCYFWCILQATSTKNGCKRSCQEPFPSVNLGLGTKQQSNKQLDAEKSWNTQTSSLDLLPGLIQIAGFTGYKPNWIIWVAEQIPGSVYLKSTLGWVCMSLTSLN